MDISKQAHQYNLASAEALYNAVQHPLFVSLFDLELLPSIAFVVNHRTDLTILQDLDVGLKESLQLLINQLLHRQQFR